ncbi:hypothetical protein [Candidatus Clostridium stratigraminis]|uniref:Uncharacterized protein n=1 Tax=Candidatus Clostridium stratigraminis TaxID=3381661 RepID=A0ABW8T644_9CLOT
MNIDEKVQLAYCLMLKSNEESRIDILLQLYDFIKELIEDIEVDFNSIRSFSLETFDMFDSIRYRYNPEYHRVCDLALKNIGYC